MPHSYKYFFKPATLYSEKSLPQVLSGASMLECHALSLTLVALISEPVSKHAATRKWAIG